MGSFVQLPPTGDLENRAEIREPATLVIKNATRSDTAKYRCEVTAIDDHKSFDEIVINLVVRGTTSPPISSNQCHLGQCFDFLKIKAIIMPTKGDLAQ